jgi:hypothetical protein
MEELNLSAGAPRAQDIAPTGKRHLLTAHPVSDLPAGGIELPNRVEMSFLISRPVMCVL